MVKKPEVSVTNPVSISKDINRPKVKIPIIGFITLIVGVYFFYTPSLTCDNNRIKIIEQPLVLSHDNFFSTICKIEIPVRNSSIKWNNVNDARVVSLGEVGNTEFSPQIDVSKITIPPFSQKTISIEFLIKTTKFKVNCKDRKIQNFETDSFCFFLYDKNGNQIINKSNLIHSIQGDFPDFKETIQRMINNDTRPTKETYTFWIKERTPSGKVIVSIF